MMHRLTTVRRIGIIRGVDPDRAADVTGAFHEAGFCCVEVPLNSPNPLVSIQRMAERYGEKLLIGAGTVLTVEQVQQVADVGGRIIVSPNTNPAVIEETKRLGLISLPGVLTPTECFTALDHGADGLKLFPADRVGTAGIKAYRAVLPPQTRVYAVGGVTAENEQDWYDAGASGIGVASNVFTPGMSLAQIRQAAATFTGVHPKA